MLKYEVVFDRQFLSVEEIIATARIINDKWGSIAANTYLLLGAYAEKFQIMIDDKTFHGHNLYNFLTLGCETLEAQGYIHWGQGEDYKIIYITQ